MSKNENEVTEMWREIHAEEQTKRHERKEKNLAILRETTLPFEYRNQGDVVLVRVAGYPKVDFYPSTNKWKFGERYILGNAYTFVLWLKKRSMK